MSPIGRSLSDSRWPIFWIAWALLSGLCATWAFAVPISGSPDEPAHIVKAAAVVRGEFIGVPGDEGSVEVRVPAYIAYSHAAPCFAFKPEKSAACMPNPPVGGSVDVTASTLAGLYNPTYYAIVGWPSLLFSDVGGIYASRIISGVASSLFLAFAMFLITTWVRPAVPLLTVAFASPPMLLFLGGAVNPNAFEATTITALFIAVLSVVRYPSAQLLNGRLTILAAAGLLGVNARGLSPVWVAAAVLLPLMLGNKAGMRALIRSPAVWITAAICLAGPYLRLGGY